MKWRCLMNRHDWEYFYRGKYLLPGWAFDLSDHSRQTCKKCGKVIVVHEGIEVFKEWGW